MSNISAWLWIIGIAFAVLVLRRKKSLPKVTSSSVNWRRYIPDLGDTGKRLTKLFPALIVIVVITLTFSYWDLIKEEFSNWLAASDGGQAIGLTAEGIKKWLWLVACLTFVLIAVIFVGVRKNIGEGLKTGGYILLLVSMAFFFHRVDTGMLGKTDCSSPKYVGTIKLDSPVCITITSDDRRMVLFTEGPKNWLEFKYPPEMKARYGEEILGSTPVNNFFFWVNGSFGQNGNGYRIDGGALNNKVGGKLNVIVIAKTMTEAK